MDKLYDITEVCESLGTTSRTLRFYEEKGIIKSTKEPYSQRRKYTEKQLEHIKCVFVLRSIGIGIKEIENVLRDEISLENVVKIKRAERFALIEKCRKEIILLDEALRIMDSGESVYSIDTSDIFAVPKEEYKKIVKKCTSALLLEKLNDVSEYFSDDMLKVRASDTVTETFRRISEPLGNFVSSDKIVTEKGRESVVRHYLKYERMGIIIKYVFRDELIHGLWFDYYE